MSKRLMKKIALGSSALCLMGSAALADQVINDDLIVSGSACVGFDCSNGESFGFDTIRMKENNIRIKADDTSVSGSFPRNDWQLTFNDSANGGANKFSIDDITNSRTPFTIEAIAPSHSLYIDDGGHVGLGTATPAVGLHLKDGNTPTLRLEQDGSSGFAPQIFDMAANETNFFVRDVTNGSDLSFRIFPDAGTNALVIEGSTGDIGLGTNTPEFSLHAYGSGNQIALLESPDGGAVQLRLESSNPTNRRVVAVDGNGSPITQLALNDTDIRLYGTDFNDPWLKIDANGITTTGGGACDPGPCDRTFDPEFYTVESIEDHAAFMWENSYLWGVGPTPEGAPVNLTKKTTGILHELEKAHIYIEQLHTRLKALEEQTGLGQL